MNAKSYSRKQEFQALSIVSAYHLGKHLVALIKNTKLTRLKLAQMVPCSYSQINKIVNGTSSPTIKLLFKIARALKLRNYQDVFPEYPESDIILVAQLLASKYSNNDILKIISLSENTKRKLLKHIS